MKVTVKAMDVMRAAAVSAKVINVVDDFKGGRIIPTMRSIVGRGSDSGNCDSSGGNK